MLVALRLRSPELWSVALAKSEDPDPGHEYEPLGRTQVAFRPWQNDCGRSSAVTIRVLAAVGDGRAGMKARRDPSCNPPGEAVPELAKVADCGDIYFFREIVLAGSRLSVSGVGCDLGGCRAIGGPTGAGELRP